MATVRPKGKGAWEVRVYVGFDRRGRPRQVSRVYRGPKRGLNRFVAELEKQFDEVGVDGATATVGELLERWLTQHPEWAPYTLRDYRYRASAIKNDRLASVRLARLGVKEVEDWIARMRASDVGEGAVRSRVTALRAALTDAQRWEWIGRNVAALARLETPRQPEREAMPPELVLAVLAAAALQGQRQHLALRLAAISGRARRPGPRMSSRGTGSSSRPAPARCTSGSAPLSRRSVRRERGASTTFATGRPRPRSAAGTTCEASPVGSATPRRSSCGPTRTCCVRTRRRSPPHWPTY